MFVLVARDFGVDCWYRQGECVEENLMFPRIAQVWKEAQQRKVEMGQDQLNVADVQAVCQGVSDLHLRMV